MEQQILNLDQRVLDLENWADRVRNVRISQAPRTQPDGNSGGTLTGANNGLALAGTIVQLGGLLVQSTIVDGNGQAHDLRFKSINEIKFDDITDFVVESTSSLSLIGDVDATFGTASGGKVFFKTSDSENLNALNGYVPTLVNFLTGEVEYRPVQATGLYVQALQNTTQFPAGPTTPTLQVKYDTTITTSPYLSLNPTTSIVTVLAGGAGKYRIEVDANMIGFSGGSASGIPAGIFINGSVVAQGSALLSYYGNGYTDAAHLTLDVDLVPTDTIEVYMQKIGGNVGVTNMQNTNRLAITKII